MAKEMTKEVNTRNDYSVKIIETSKELTTRERVLFKDVSNAVKLDTALDSDGTPLIITPMDYAILAVHNGKSTKNPDYENYVIVDPEGNKYVTGSPSFWSAFMDIWEEMAGEDKGWQIAIYKRPSKNYNGKDFITCSII